jgi:phosphotransferase system IIB component
MKETIIKTQKELDKLSLKTEGYIYIEGGTENDPLVLKTNFEFACVIIRGSAFVQSVSGNATVQYVYDNATVQSVYGNATVQYVSGNATVQYVSDNATVRSVSDNATMQYVSDNATVQSVYGNATVQSVYGNATVQSVSDNATLNLFGEAVISNARGAKKIVLSGYNTIVVHKSDQKKLGLVMNKKSHLVIIPDNNLLTKPTFKEFAIRYAIKTKGLNAILYKSVHKVDGKYLSDKDRSFEYKIGEITEHEIDNQIKYSCAVGLHVSTLFWAVRFGSDWEDRVILECEVPIKNIIVAKDTDGKVRTSKLKVLRELDKKEY